MENKAGIFERLDTVIIRVKNIDTSKRWYTEVLQLKNLFEDDKEKLVVFDTGGAASVTIWHLKEDEILQQKSAAGTFPIFLSPDAESIHKYLKENGVEASSITESEGIKFFFFFDPDGNKLEVCQTN
ncbi:MAG: VOC family protein [Ignavibacteriales bacterium]|nr:VOC family protein [Ignavibacteriales bacterium]